MSTQAKKKPLKKDKCVRETDANLGLGTVSLVNRRLTSLEGIGIQNGLVKLYLQNNFLETFEFLGSQPHLKELYAQDNKISSFKGLQTQPKLEVFCLEGNPICAHPLFRVMCLLSVGNSLRKIDGEERMHGAKQNPKVLRALRHGWLLDYKQRTEQEYDALLWQYEHPGEPFEEPVQGIVRFVFPSNRHNEERAMSPSLSATQARIEFIWHESKPPPEQHHPQRVQDNNGANSIGELSYNTERSTEFPVGNGYASDTMYENGTRTPSPDILQPLPEPSSIPQPYQQHISRYTQSSVNTLHKETNTGNWLLEHKWLQAQVPRLEESLRLARERADMLENALVASRKDAVALEAAQIRIEHLLELLGQKEDENVQLQKEKLSLMALSTDSLIAERLQRRSIEERYERAGSPLGTRSLKGEVDTDWLSIKVGDICSCDTIQLYTNAQVPGSAVLSTCISFHDSGITFMLTDSATSRTFSHDFPLRSAIKIVKDLEQPQKVTLSRPNEGAVAVSIFDDRREFLVQLIYSWLKLK